MNRWHGIPVATVDTIVSIMAELGIRRWLEIGRWPSIEMWHTEEGIAEEERKRRENIVTRYIPRFQVARYQMPNGKRDDYFQRKPTGHWVVTLPQPREGMIIVGAEFVAESDILLVTPISGRVKNAELPETTAGREWQEETCTTLSKIRRLTVITRDDGMFTVCTGEMEFTENKPEVKLEEKTERNTAIALPFQDWIEIVRRGSQPDYGIHFAGTGATLAWLLDLGWIQPKR